MVGAAIGTKTSEAYSKQIRLLEVVLERSALAQDVVLGKYSTRLLW